jgi:hypothetical protein
MAGIETARAAKQHGRVSALLCSTTFWQPHSRLALLLVQPIPARVAQATTARHE